MVRDTTIIISIPHSGSPTCSPTALEALNGPKAGRGIIIDFELL